MSSNTLWPVPQQPGLRQPPSQIFVPDAASVSESPPPRIIRGVVWAPRRRARISVLFGPVTSSVSETLVPGGALAGGVGLTATVAVGAGGAVAQGTAATTTESVAAGGAIAAGTATTAAVVAVAAGGAVADGVAPTEIVVAGTAPAIIRSAHRPVPGERRVSTLLGPLTASTAVSETPTPGGAVATGIGATAKADVAAGGALAAGLAPAESIVAASVVPRIAQGIARAERQRQHVSVLVGPLTAAAQPASETPVPGGALAGGRTPTAAVTVWLGMFGEGPFGGFPFGGTGFALGGSTTATVQVAVPQGGAAAGGNAPSETVAVVVIPRIVRGRTHPRAIQRAAVLIRPPFPVGITETPVPGGAVANGTTATARVASSNGGATAAGTSTGAAVSVSTGGAVANGRAPTYTLAETPGRGGAIAGGIAPTEVDFMPNPPEFTPTPVDGLIFTPTSTDPLTFTAATADGLTFTAVATPDGLVFTPTTVDPLTFSQH